MNGDVPASDDEATERLRDRFRGLLLGLALGDALGVPVQHRRPGSFSRVGDLLGGGPYDLPRGAWSDDTATALHSADSLVALGNLDPVDLQARWTRWQQTGAGSATGHCLGISAALAAALAPVSADLSTSVLDGEPLPRAAVAAAFGFGDASFAVQLAATMARCTHPAPLVVDTTRVYAVLVIGALQGATRDQLLGEKFLPEPFCLGLRPLARLVRDLHAGSWQHAQDPIAEGSARADAVGTLMLTYGALSAGRSFKDMVLAAVNAGCNADLSGAVVGALAGALYGAAALPVHWLAALTDREGIERRADRLLVASLTRLLDASSEVSA